MSKRGLILGKLAPLHNGHLFLIDSALKMVDELIVVIYDCPDKTEIPLNVRAGWLRKLYPNVEVIEGWDAPNQHEDTPEVRRRQERYIAGLLHGKKITHFISSEYYGEHMSLSLQAENIVVDMERKSVPISSTMIRKDSYGKRHQLPALVLNDTLLKIAVIGRSDSQGVNLVKKITDDFRTVFLPDSLASLADKGCQSSVSFKRLAVKMLKERSNPASLYQAREVIFYHSATIMNLLLYMLVARKYSETLYEQAKEEMWEFDQVFISTPFMTGLCRVYGLDSNILYNQLRRHLDTLRVQPIILDGTLEQQRQAIQQYVRGHLKKNIRQ